MDMDGKCRFNHHMRIPLPVIVWGTDGLHVFSSSKLADGVEYKDGNAVYRIAAKDSEYKGKVVEIVNGKEIKPWDFSITKNVCALFITVLIILWVVLSLARWYKKGGMKAPRKFHGAMEALIQFIYDGMVKPILGKKAPRFAPYLLTVFLFILTMNLLGLIVIFPVVPTSPVILL